MNTPTLRFSALALAMLLCSLVTLHPDRASAADPANRFWYTVTISKVNTTEIFTGSSDLSPEQFATNVAGSTPVLLENLRVEALIPGDDAVRWHAVVENPNVYIMPRAVLFFRELRVDPLLEKRPVPATFRSVR